MKFVLATHNPGKLKEMADILSGLGVEVVSPADVGISVDVEETGTTFAENAMLKAKAICAASGLPAIADDSGLCVDALNGGPGVYSARYGGGGAPLHPTTRRYRNHGEQQELGFIVSKPAFHDRILLGCGMENRLRNRLTGAGSVGTPRHFDALVC